MKNKPKFRAFYTPDFTTEAGAMLFCQKLVEDANGVEDIKFIYEEEGKEDFGYDFQIPFLDDDWIVQQFTGMVGRDGEDVYEGDYVELDNAGSEAMPEGSRGKYEVYFKRGSFHLKEIKPNWSMSPCFIKSNPVGSFNIMSVIGNVYEDKYPPK
tara:strand:- start:870 stop:1331 length:462 start_codon:yes stop_codon:yes gene_type:complete